MYAGPVATMLSSSVGVTCVALMANKEREREREGEREREKGRKGERERQGDRET